MEPKAAVMMWSRHVQKNGLRYVSMISDGDSSTIKQIKEAEVYNAFMVEKKECVNHVAKRLNTALRKVVDDKRKQKVTLGGNVIGKLTAAKISRFQKYYTRAVRSHSTVDGMRKAIWAIFNHCCSTDASPEHDGCPVGPESWCFFQNAVARGLLPPEHAKHMTSFINPLVANNILHVFERLSDPELLRKCVDGLTQNVNESIHALIWTRCPKHIFVGRRRLEIALTVGVGEFNQGARASHLFLKSLGFDLGHQMLRYGQVRNSKRKRKADRALESISKKRRELMREARSRLEERFVEMEGGTQYGAGEL